MPTATEYQNMPALITTITTTRLVEMVTQQLAYVYDARRKIEDSEIITTILRAEIIRRGVTPP
jgi:hypothetical protein